MAACIAIKESKYKVEMKKKKLNPAFSPPTPKHHKNLIKPHTPSAPNEIMFAILKTCSVHVALIFEAAFPLAYLRLSFLSAMFELILYVYLFDRLFEFN